VFHVKSNALARLTAQYSLSEGQQEQLTTILDQLSGDELAPTTVRDPLLAVDAHIADSLVALALEPLHSADRIADIGAGAGFPGLALAVALPGSEVRLIESQASKCAFMERVCAAARIGNATVVCARVEEWREGTECHDIVTARALAPPPVVLEYAAPLLRIGGMLVDWRGRRDEEQEKEAALAAEQLGLHLTEIRRVEPFEGVRDHHLHLYMKRTQTPERFPRRAGMARKRPLARPTAERPDPDQR
jgi:16S rRNA (guanine527-N7)-methyltransferase